MMFTYFRKLKMYNATYRELASLSDRELNDIGLSRSSIRRIALEHAGMA